MKYKTHLINILKAKRLIIILLLISIFIFIFFLSNCYPLIIEEDLPIIEDDYLIIKIEGSAFTLSWDAPSDSSHDSYRIYYKQHNSLIWNFLNELSSDINPEYEINYEDLDGGIYHDFGVIAVYGEIESRLHYSLDAWAVPDTGWYVKLVL